MKRWWNYHPLVLFCHVARHGGISAALPYIGYSLQQPALSKQMRELERLLGHVLFIRQPFKLTPIGERVYGALEQFVGHVQRVLDDIVDGSGPILRVGAPLIVLSHYFPAVVSQLRRREPRLRIELQAPPTHAALLDAVDTGQLDLAVTTDARARPRLVSTPLLSAQPALLAPGGATLPPLGVLAGQQPLICSTGSAALWGSFDAKLKERGLTWRPSTLVNSLMSVASFVAAGQGIGLGIDLPGLFPHLTVQPLTDCAPVAIVAAHRSTPCRNTELLMAALRKAAQGAAVPP